MRRPCRHRSRAQRTTCRAGWRIRRTAGPAGGRGRQARATGVEQLESRTCLSGAYASAPQIRAAAGGPVAPALAVALPGMAVASLAITPSAGAAIDTVRPTLTIGSEKAALKAGESSTLTFALSEPTTDFTLDDIVPTRGTLSNFSGSGANYTVTFTPAPAATGPGGVAVGAGRFRDAAGNPNVAGVLRPVLKIDTARPTVASIAGPAAKAYAAGAVLSFTMRWSEPVKVFGVPSLPVEIGPAVRNAVWNGKGGGTNSLTFTTVVQRGDADGDGVRVVGPISLAVGSAIRDAAGNDAVPAAAAAFSKVVVDTVGPGVTTFGSPAVSGRIVSLSVAFDEPVVVTGRPLIAATVAGRRRWLGYAAGSGGKVLAFTYTAPLGETPTPANVVVPVTTITVAGPARITDAAGNPALSLGLPAVAASGPQILLDSSTLARLRQTAAANTPQWQAFRQRLDDNLDVVLADDTGAYQGSHLTFISDYALGYQVLKDTDPRTAADYADKAISLIRSGLRDHQKGSWTTRQFLARGDGATRSFTLPDADVHAGTLTVYLSAVNTFRVVHSARDGRDPVGYYQQYLKVSATPDGAPAWGNGVSWLHNPNDANNLIDWSLPGAEPAVGSTYYVTATSGMDADRTAAFVLAGSRITFAQAPRANQAIFVQYIHGRHSADGSTLDYQDTSAGDGGFNSIFVDDTYSSRYLGKHLAMGLDWLDGYAGFSAPLKSEVSTMLVRWADWLSTPNADAFDGYNGYFYTSPASNYGAGSYAALAMTAVALRDRSPAGPRLLDKALDYRRQYLLPALQNPTNSLAGGYWSEGWNYGNEGVQNLLLAARSLEAAGAIDAAAERQWADEVVDSLIIQQSAPGLVYDGGDTYQFPFRLLDKGMFNVLSAMAGDASRRAYANHVLHNYPDEAFFIPGDTNDYRDLLFRDPGAAARDWDSQPLQRLASGTGLVTARSDWGDTPTWVSLHIGNLLRADHQTYSPGQLQISRGKDQLLINAFQVEHVYGDDSAGLRSLSQFGNIVAVNDRNAVDAYGSRLQETPFCMGVDYGEPGVSIQAFEAASDHVYVAGDYHAAYSYVDQPGAGGPASELTRQMVFLRPDRIFIYDRVTTTHPEYDKQLRWNFMNAPVVAGDTFTETVGDSRLFARTFSTNPLATASQVVRTGQIDVHRVVTQNVDGAASARFLTVFQTAAASATTMDATTHVRTADDRMEGAQIGDQLVLFGRTGAVDLATPVTYALTGDDGVANLLANLSAGAAYRVVADGQPVATVTASANGTLSFTTPAAARTIQVAREP